MRSPKAGVVTGFGVRPGVKRQPRISVEYQTRTPVEGVSIGARPQRCDFILRQFQPHDAKIERPDSLDHGETLTAPGWASPMPDLSLSRNPPPITGTCQERHYGGLVAEPAIRGDPPSVFWGICPGLWASARRRIT